MAKKRWERRALIRRSLLLIGVWLWVNGLLFAAYRVQFLNRCSLPIISQSGGKVLINGLRLDFALMGFEMFGVGLATVALRKLRMKRVFRWLLGLTFLHVLICMANYFTFTERSQNAADLLLPYITSPYQVILAVLPFCQQYLWLLILVLAFAMVVYWWLGIRVARRMEKEIEVVDLWRSPRALAMMIAITLLPLLLTFQPLIKRKLNIRSSGLTLAFANSKFYAHFSDFRLNEAMLNPLYEFVGTQLPAALHQTVRNRLSESEALEQCRQDLQLVENATYPLLRTIHGREGSTLENIIIVQVEGLSGSVLDQERNGRYVTPFLRKLAKEGIYFPNTIQNANFTSGGVFSTATGIPKATWEETTHRFAGHEMRGYYGTLARVLGTSNYTHYYFEAFRQSGDDFLALMANQGCNVLNYQEFHRRLKAQNELAAADSILGIYDGFFMQQSMDELERCPTRVTAHLMTCTTHSPWTTPAAFAKALDDPAMNTFAYFDASLEALVKRIEQSPKLRGSTLLVVLGDHTSITFGDNLLERLRIPLIFYAPTLPRFERSSDTWASQVDVLPTILALMPGDNKYAGMCRNLLDPAETFPGAISGTRDTGYLVTEDWVFQCHPFGGGAKLYAVKNGVATAEDCAAEHSEILKQLERKYYARVELARHLGKERRIYPLPTDQTSSIQSRAEVRPASKPSAIR